jgi:hypothetical protein
VRRQRAEQYLNWRVDEDGSIVGSFRLSADRGKMFLRGLEVERGRLPGPIAEGQSAAAQGDAGPAAPPGSPQLDAANALVAMAERSVDVSAETSSAAAERVQLVIHSTIDALQRADADDDAEHLPGAELEDGTRLHPATARRLTCDCAVTHLIETTDGAPLHAGRKTRRITGRLRRAVMARDRGRCRAPACTNAATQIHHRWHWCNGGKTCIGNLVSLCDAHHWLVHEGGWTLNEAGPNRWALIGPSGVTVDPSPPVTAPSEPLPYDERVAPDAVAGHWDGTRLRAGYAAGILLGNEATAARRAGPPPGAISWIDEDGQPTWLANPDGTPWIPGEDCDDDDADVLDWLNDSASVG